MLDSGAILLLRIWMLLKEPLDFAQNFIKSVNEAIKLETPGKALSRAQCYWLSFCITAVILTNSVCWIRFEKISLGRFKSSSLSWMFRRGKICWEHLLVYSVQVLLQKYGIHQGTLLRRFGADFTDIKVQCILADALYGDKKFMDQASHCFGGVQAISQLKNNQMIRIKGRKNHSRPTSNQILACRNACLSVAVNQSPCSWEEQDCGSRPMEKNAL